MRISKSASSNSLHSSHKHIPEFGKVYHSYTLLLVSICNLVTFPINWNQYQKWLTKVTQGVQRINSMVLGSVWQKDLFLLHQILRTGISNISTDMEEVHWTGRCRARLESSPTLSSSLNSSQNSITSLRPGVQTHGPIGTFYIQATRTNCYKFSYLCIFVKYQMKHEFIVRYPCFNSLYGSI